MKISREFPQFRGEVVLLLVAGRQDATIYLATDGTIVVRDTIHIEKPVYSDREGHFETRGGGRVYGSGSVYEPKDDVVAKEFLKELVPRIARILRENRISQVFLFVPSYVRTALRRVLPRDLKEKIQLMVSGNFGHSHPFDLLRRITKRMEEQRMPLPVPEEARKILDRDQAG